MTKNLKKSLGRLVLVVLGVLIGFLVLEIGLRVATPSNRQSVSEIILTADDRGNTIHRANLDLFIHSKEIEKEVHFKTNNEGFIGNDYSLEKPDDVIRIALLGDSLLAAQELDFENNFAFLLEDKLNEPEHNQKFEIMNFGVGGQGTVEELIRYDQYVKKYNPDYVFLFFFPNDLENNQYYLPHRELFLNNDPAWSEIPISDANNSRSRKDLKYKIIQNSLLVQQIDSLVRQNTFLAKIAISMGLQDAGIMGTPKDGIHPLLFSFEEPLPTTHKTVYEFTKELMEFMDDRVTENRSKLVVVYLPWAIQVDNILWEENSATTPSIKDYSWDLNLPNNYLNTKLRDNIPYLDMTPLLRSLYEQDSDLILYNNRRGHLNTEGHAVTEEILREYITSLLVN